MSKKNSVKVCVRTRPTHQFAQDNIFIDEEHATVQVSFCVLLTLIIHYPNRHRQFHQTLTLDLLVLQMV